MKTSQLITIVCTLTLTAVAGTGKADVVAGWDFSQYVTRGFLTLDGTTFVDTLDANYSNLDESLNLGPDSGQFGVALFDGSMQSDDVDENSATPAFYPTGADPWDRTQLRDGPILSNRKAPVREPGNNRFDSFAALRSQGQAFTNRFAMRAGQPVNVVFMGDAGSDMAGWEIAFGARSFRGSSSIAVQYDLGCQGSYTSHENSPVTLDGEDKRYHLVLPTDPAQTACVKLGLTPGPGQPVIDNVALLPEPTSLLLQAGSLLGIGLVARARRRRACRLSA